MAKNDMAGGQPKVLFSLCVRAFCLFSFLVLSPSPSYGPESGRLTTTQRLIRIQVYVANLSRSAVI